MADEVLLNPSSAFLPIGPFMIGAGWSTVMTYPSLQTNWVFWQSPNSAYWGPSGELRATLQAGNANVIEIPGVPDGALTYSEGRVFGLSQGKVNNLNGNVAATEANRLLTGPSGETFESQRFFVNGKLFTEG
jgi:hypothetical protein